MDNNKRHKLNIMYKKANVVMLSSSKASLLYRIHSKANDKRMLGYGEDITKNLSLKSQHLYILSDEQIKKEDWCINLNTNTILQVHEISTNISDYEGEKIIIDKHELSHHYYKECKKIIATTNDLVNPLDAKEIKDWYLPQLPQSFIKKYVEEYNKGNIITEVMVEYVSEEYCLPMPNIHVKQYINILKVNTKDNTINIKPIKDSWSKEEVRKLFNEWNNFVYKGYYVGKKDLETILDYSDKWINENL